MLKLFLIRTGIKLVSRFGQELIKDGKVSKEDAKQILTEEVFGLLKRLPNEVTDEARKKEQSRRSKEEFERRGGNR